MFENGDLKTTGAPTSKMNHRQFSFGIYLFVFGILVPTSVEAFKKALVTKIRFGIIPKEFQNNATAVFGHELEPVNGMSAWSVVDSSDIKIFDDVTETPNKDKPNKKRRIVNRTRDEKRSKDKNNRENVDRRGWSKINLLDILAGQAKNELSMDCDHNCSEKEKRKSLKDKEKAAKNGNSSNNNDNNTNETESVDDLVKTGDVSEGGSKATFNVSGISKIVGGTQSFPNDWPSEASVQYLGTDGYWHHFCGGSLVHEQWVVTVAHCLVKLEDYIIRVVVGDYRLGSVDGREQIASPSNIFVHTYFNQPEYTHDIGLIKLLEPVTLNSYVKVALMATPEMEPFGESHECYVAGWGSTEGQQEGLVTPDYLQETRMRLITQRECRRGLNINGVLADSHLCTVNEFSSICIGDSGSPLDCWVEDRWVLAGLASWIRDGTCEPSVPNVFTRISSFHNWCHAVIEQH